MSHSSWYFIYISWYVNTYFTSQTGREKETRKSDVFKSFSSHAKLHWTHVISIFWKSSSFQIICLAMWQLHTSRTLAHPTHWYWYMILCHSKFLSFPNHQFEYPFIHVNKKHDNESQPLRDHHQTIIFPYVFFRCYSSWTNILAKFTLQGTKIIPLYKGWGPMIFLLS